MDDHSSFGRAKDGHTHMPSVGKLCCSHTMEYYLVIKRGRLLMCISFATSYESIFI